MIKLMLQNTQLSLLAFHWRNVHPDLPLKFYNLLGFHSSDNAQGFMWCLFIYEYIFLHIFGSDRTLIQNGKRQITFRLKNHRAITPRPRIVLATPEIKNRSSVYWSNRADTYYIINNTLICKSKRGTKNCYEFYTFL